MKVFCNSIPKCGSYLLMRAVKCVRKLDDYGVIQNKRNKIDAINRMPEETMLVGHQQNNKRITNALLDNNVVILFIVRDPRDMVVSRYYFEKSDRIFMRHRRFQAMPKEIAYNEIIRSVLGGVNNKPAKSINITDYFKSFSYYLYGNQVTTIRFEDLVGSKGGGCDKRQRDALTKIGTAINSKVDIDKIAQSIFSTKSATFRKGQIGQWRYEFSKPNKRLFNKIAGKLLVRLGYE